MLYQTRRLPIQDQTYPCEAVHTKNKASQSNRCIREKKIQCVSCFSRWDRSTRNSSRRDAWALSLIYSSPVASATASETIWPTASQKGGVIIEKWSAFCVSAIIRPCFKKEGRKHTTVNLINLQPITQQILPPIRPEMLPLPIKPRVKVHLKFVQHHLL